MSSDIDAEAMRNGKRVFAGLFLLIGFVSIVGGVVWLAKTARFCQSAHRGVATIEAIEETRSPRSNARYPRYSFVDDRGNAHTKRSAFSLDGKSWDWTVGQTIEVLYDPGDPEQSILNEFGQLWSTPIAFTGFAMLWTLVVGCVARSK